MKEDLLDALMRHVSPITKSWTIFLDELDLIERVRERVLILLDKAAIAFRDDTACCRHPAAQTLVLAGYSDRVPAEFWGTDLGQLMFKLGGYPYSSVPTQDVKYLLGVSRQAIGQMRVRGVLVSNLSLGPTPNGLPKPIGQYSYESVALRWRASRSRQAADHVWTVEPIDL